ncbi:hypothetical protein C3Y87_17355 [Carbonactinospora thermoautotrophica]|nr:hypothetical protein [Carbonactinospora thermoautotrophica]
MIYAEHVAKDLRRIDPSRRRIRTALEALAHDPRPAGCRPLVGYPGSWRIRVGDYRIIDTIEDHRLIVIVPRLAHPREIHDRL